MGFFGGLPVEAPFEVISQVLGLYLEYIQLFY